MQIQEKRNITEKTYDSSNIKVLKGLEPVRKRPGMYIGSTDRSGLHHLIWEIVDNSVDEAMAGYCDMISVSLNKDLSVTVEDNGRGIPVDFNEEENASALTLIFTVLHAGGKFDNDEEESAYKTSGGLHGVGASVVNALSKKMSVLVKKDGGVYEQTFEKGIPTSEVTKIGEMKPEDITGTSVTFYPDEEIFEDAVEEGGMHFDFEHIAKRMKQLSYLNKGLTLVLKNGDQVENFFSENGLIDMINDNLSSGEEKVIQDMEKEENVDKVDIQIALNYVKGHQIRLGSFVNNIHTYEGGTHEMALLDALSRTVTSFAQEEMNLKNEFKKDDVMEGINLVLSIKLAHAKFVGQTKRKLQSSQARKAVYKFAKDFFETEFEKNPDIAKIIVKKSEAAQAARIAAEKSRENVRRQQVGKSIGGLPGKLADCSSRKPEDCEIYLVEGDSAGGSAKQGRDRKTQAILPLKGKVLNTMKSDLKKMLESKEIQYLISSIKTNIGEDFNIDKLRYHKIIIMTDADVDGSHIATLLLTFFMTQMPELIKGGFVYLAMPPLYKAKKKSGKNTDYKYYLDEDEREKDTAVNESSSWEISRFKGLGEMNPQELWETTMNPQTRKLQKIMVTEENLQDCYNTLEKLMGDEVPPRRAFLEENAEYADLDI